MLLMSACALLLFAIVQQVSYRLARPWGWRASVVLAAVGWGSLLVALTELLSLGSWLNAARLAIGWAVILTALLALLIWLTRRTDFKRPSLPQLRRDTWRWIGQQGAFNWALYAVLAVQAVALAVVALSYAPNTFEAMRYHLPRVMHWLQGANLATFASSNVRENYFPPFAEYVFLHLMALTGGDRYVNLIQVGAFLLCLIGVSAIAEQLGANRNTQVAASVLAAGIPLAVLQASAARNDLVLAVWLLSLVWFGLCWTKSPGSWLFAAGTGLSLGLALLTKSTAYVFAFPLCLMVGVMALRSGGLRPGLTRGLVVLSIAAALNLGHVVRNWALYSDPRGIWGRVGTEVTTPAIVASTAIRNVALHVPTNCRAPLNILDGPGALVLRGLESMHSLTGHDPTDPATTWGIRNVFKESRGCVYDEQEGGNPLHALLIFMTALAMPFMRPGSTRAKWLGLALMAGFALLSLFVRWQIWAAYLQIPLFVLWMPVVAVTLAEVRWADLARPIALLALVLSFFWIYNNRARPLSKLINGSAPPRDQQYFAYYLGAFMYPQYRSVARLVAEAGCERVGLRVDSPVLEYPFWVLLKEEGFAGEIQHVEVGNELSAYEDPLFIPCAVISEDASERFATSMREQVVGPFHLYLNQTTTAP